MNKNVPCHLNNTSNLTSGHNSSVVKDIHIILSSNTVLPIDEKKQEIIDTIKQHDEIVIVAETGAGKSTRVPQYLYEAGYNVIITQPRVLATVSLARHVADEMVTPLGSIVGYHTGGGKPQNRVFSERTGIKYCTDGLQVVKQLVDNASNKHNEKETALIIDEVHERNKNIEVLLARIKKMKTEGRKIKVICMSATLDADRLQLFVSGANATHPARKIEVGGRLFKVTEQQEDKDSLLDTIVQHTLSGANTLVFQPGKKEIDECINNLKMQHIDAVILPLHGELSADEQQRIYEKYNKPVIIVSTNIAQTSVTIPYIDAVVDSGLERRIELINGVETLVLGNISKADCKQRAGRAGRCKEGMYTLCNDTPREIFADYPIPEIQRTRVDLNYIRILASSGLKMEDLDFFHPVQSETITQAKKTLHLLGAIDDNDHVTMIGKKLAMLPTDVNTGKMILESVKYGCLQDIITISAIRQAKGILEHREFIKHKDKTIYVGSTPENCIDRDSDLITQLNLFNHAWRNRIFDREALAKIGINAKSYEKAKEAVLQIEESLRTSRFDFNHLEHSLTGKSKKEGLMLSIAAGLLDNIRIRKYGGYSNNKDEIKEIDKKSVVRGGQLVVASPKTIEFEFRGRKMKKELISELTNISLEMLKQIAPHLFTHATKNISRDRTLQKFIQENTTLFNGLELDSEVTDAPKSRETMKEFARILGNDPYNFSGIYSLLDNVIEHNMHIENEIYKLRNIIGDTRQGKNLPFITNNSTGDFYYEVLHGHKIDSVEELQQFIDTYGSDVFKIGDIETIIPEYKKIKKIYPDAININNTKIYIRYSYNSIAVEVDESTMNAISENTFINYFEGKRVGFYVKGVGYFGSLSEYNIHKNRQEKAHAFDVFVTSKQTIQQAMAERDGIYTNQQQEYLPGEFAYSGITLGYDQTVWTEKWFIDKNEAESGTLRIKNIFEEQQARQALRAEANDMTDTIEQWRSKYLDNISDADFDSYTSEVKTLIKNLDSTRDAITDMRDGHGDITTSELENILVNIGVHNALEKQFIILFEQQIKKVETQQPNFAEQLKNVWK